MKKKWDNTKYARKTGHSSRLKWAVIIFMVIILLLATGFLLVKHKKSAVLSHWFSPLRHQIQQHKAPPPDIHFEFYTTLPNMQIKVGEAKKIPKETKIFDAARLENALANEIHKNRK